MILVFVFMLVFMLVLSSMLYPELHIDFFQKIIIRTILLD